MPDTNPDAVRLQWIKLSERQPPYGKLVYTKDDKDQIGVYTRYPHPTVGDCWTSLISTDNNAIVAWLEQYCEDDLKGICVYCGYVEQYESMEQKSSEEGNRMRIEHIKQCDQRPELKLIAELERLIDAHGKE